MSKKKIVLFVFAALIAAVGALVLNMRWNNRRTPALTDGGGAESASAGEAAKAQLDAGAESLAQTDSGADSDDDAEGVETPDDGAASDAESDEEDAEEKLVNEFDDFSDKWNNPVSKEATMSDIDEFKRRFARVPDSRKGECLQRSLNLLPDENVMLLAGLLLDKSLDKEYMELVFNDVLNRDEEVKKPILEEIYKDKTHPCWANAAWIFDATGETPGRGGETADPVHEDGDVQQ